MSDLECYGLEIITEHFLKIGKTLCELKKDSRFSGIDCTLNEDFVAYLCTCNNPDDILNEHNINANPKIYNHLRNCGKCYDLGRAVLESVPPLSFPKLNEVPYN